MQEKSRREFLALTGKGILGAAALSALPLAVTSAKADEEIGAPEYPWVYVAPDKEAVQKHAYEAFYSHGGCCAGAVAGILETMADQHGYPYNQIPARMFANGAGGYGAQTLCGSLGGALAVIGLFCPAKESGEIRNQLYAWYKEAAFPIYQPKMESITTVSGSILCADSVGTYMKATGYTMADDGRKARCAGVTADVAMKTIELLNQHFGFEAAPVEVASEAAATLAANEYIGTSKNGNGGVVKVKVTMDGDKIAKIDVLEHNETPGLSDPAIEKIPAAILAAQSTKVDTITGATLTSNALIEAVNDALSQVKK